MVGLQALLNHQTANVQKQTAMPAAAHFQAG
jgi:hypothetical protein